MKTGLWPSNRVPNAPETLGIIALSSKSDSDFKTSQTTMDRFSKTHPQAQQPVQNRSVTKKTGLSLGERLSIASNNVVAPCMDRPEHWMGLPTGWTCFQNRWMGSQNRSIHIFTQFQIQKPTFIEFYNLWACLAMIALIIDRFLSA